MTRRKKEPYSTRRTWILGVEVSKKIYKAGGLGGGGGRGEEGLGHPGPAVAPPEVGGALGRVRTQP